MARVLLINSNRFRHPWPVIPFGLLYVASSLDNSENEVQLLDLCFSLTCEEEIQKTIRNFVPDVIGISIRNIDDTGGYNVHFILEDVKNDVIDHCKKAFGGPIVIGGPSVGISGREMLDFFDLEFAIRGDGEMVMPEFVRRIETRSQLEGLPGLIIRRGKTIIEDNEPFRINKLDLIPFPKPLLYINLDPYRRFGSPVHIQTKRGCSFRCSYCTYNRIEGRRYRLRNPRLIADEIEILVKETRINNLEFTDSIFNTPLTHAKDVMREVIKKKLRLSLHTMGLTPAAIDEELIDLMKYAGFNEVDVGAESLCDEVLKSLAKDFNRSDIIKAAELLKKKKMPVTWFILLGAISESRESVHETLSTIGKLASKWDLVFISTGVRVYNGAPIADEIRKDNPECTVDNFLHPLKIEPEKITLTEIHSIAKEYSQRFPNFYFYEKEHITPGWLLMIANFLLRIFGSHQPVWRLLILLKRVEKSLGITFVKKIIYSHRASKDKLKGFSLINVNKKH